MEKHYVCKGGCGDVSIAPGACAMDGCKKQFLPLAECDCVDNSHLNAKEESEESPVETE